MGKSKEEKERLIAEDAARRADLVSKIAIAMCFGMLIVSAAVFVLLPKIAN
jgi:hypothetical protein